MFNQVYLSHIIHSYIFCKIINQSITLRYQTKVSPGILSKQWRDQLPLSFSNLFFSNMRNPNKKIQHRKVTKNRTFTDGEPPNIRNPYCWWQPDIPRPFPPVGFIILPFPQLMIAGFLNHQQYFMMSSCQVFNKLTDLISGHVALSRRSNIVQQLQSPHLCCRVCNEVVPFCACQASSGYLHFKSSSKVRFFSQIFTLDSFTNNILYNKNLQTLETQKHSKFQNLSHTKHPFF